MGFVTDPLMPIVQVYVRVACYPGVKVSLWASKFCLAPSWSYTIPRLELMYLIMSKLVVTVRETVECEAVPSGECCWSDSEVDLWWTRQQSKKWNAWVQNRVEDIRHYKSNFIGHIFYLILMHQTFPHTINIIKKVHRIILASLAYHFLLHSVSE